jgi:hypothetical protein
MNPIDRRTFLSSLAGSLVFASTQSVASALPLAKLAGASPRAAVAPDACWLDVAAPFVLSDPKLGIETQFVLTATCFPGVDGYRDPNNQTAYQILLFDAKGNPIKLDRDGRLDIPALHTTLVELSELAHRQQFWGGAKIRLAPTAHQVSHAGDLFSAGFTRWQTPSNFDNVHAHPAAPQQAIGHYNYSMPLPALSEYHCMFSLFNPAEEASEGSLRVVNRMGQTVAERPYHLEPHHTLLYSLEDLHNFENPGEGLAVTPLSEKRMADGGVIVVHNTADKVAFAYTLMRGREGGTFTVEHPLHFSSDVEVKPARTTPYGPNHSFPAVALLYTPLLFTGLAIGGLTLDSRFYLSASRWVEEALWLMPFATTGSGTIGWVSNRDEHFPDRVEPAALTDQGLLRLEEFQSVRMDARALPLPPNFSGGFGVATIPGTSHSLLKAEVRVREWNRAAFTHFRPGGAPASKYRLADDRGGVATDYIVTDVQIRSSDGQPRRDAVLAVMNIEFQHDITGAPKLQLFGPEGLMAEKSIGEFPPLACRHLLLSQVFPGLQTEPEHPVTVRMVDANALMVCSAVHFDYDRRDLALEHGSDRHSTFTDFKC